VLARVKVKIRFVEDKWEGEVRWVSPARLEVPWAGVGPYRDHELEMAAVWTASKPDPVEGRAAEFVFLETIDIDVVAWIKSPSQGVTEIYDLVALAAAAGLDVDELLMPPMARDYAVIYVPWATTLRVARGLAAKHAGRLMVKIDEREEVARKESIMGAELPDWLGADRPALTAVQAQRSFEKHEKPMLLVIRKWAGQQAVDQKSVRELERELSRVGDIALRAIAAVRRLRSPRQADALLAEFLDPLSALQNETGHIYEDERQRALDSHGRYEWIYRPAAGEPAGGQSDHRDAL